jgi:hypothetical protein
MKVDIYRLGESDDSWAVFVEGSKIDDLSGLTQEQAQRHAGLIMRSYVPGSGVVELPDTSWRDTGSGPGADYGTVWERHDDPEQQP